MITTNEQLRAGRALLHLEQTELAERAHVSVVTIRRIEAAAAVSATTTDSVRRVLEEAGVEFIQGGVKRRTVLSDHRGLLGDLQAISERSASRLQARDMMTEAELYDEAGLPA